MAILTKARCSIFAPGVSDNPEFVDCGENLVIEKRRDLFVPNPNYLYVVENYRQPPNGSWRDVIIYLDSTKRFRFAEGKLYAYSTYEGRPTYYVLDTRSGQLEAK